MTQMRPRKNFIAHFALSHSLTYPVVEKRTMKMNGVARDGQHLDAALPVDVEHPDLPHHRQPQGPEKKTISLVDKLVDKEYVCSKRERGKSEEE